MESRGRRSYFLPSTRRHRSRGGIDYDIKCDIILHDGLRSIKQERVNHEVIKITTLIPLYRNDGSAVRDSEMQEILDGLAEQFGGNSDDGLTEGRWVDQATGVLYRDQSRRVSIGIDAGRMAEAEAAIIEIGKRLGQLAMYCEIQQTTEIRILEVK